MNQSESASSPLSAEKGAWNKSFWIYGELRRDSLTAS
jgi:hypothetical protein